MEGSSQNWTQDYFDDLFENRASKFLFMAVSALLIIGNLCLSYSIIWYERFGLDAKRTLLNQLFSLHCWSAIMFLILVTIPEWIRFLSGPGPRWLCWFHLTIKNWTVSNTLLLQTALIVARYAYIFWLKNPAAFNDDFWCRFIHIWVNFASFLPHFVFSLLPGRQHIGYYICTGQNPAIDYLLPQKINYYHLYVWLLSLIVHVPISVRILWYKRKKQNTVIAMSNSTYIGILTAVDKHSLSGFMTISVSLICGAFIGFTFIKYSQSQPENMKVYPNYLLAYWIQLICGPLVINIMLILSFVRNGEMRKMMYREFKEFFHRLL